ncbi:MAG: GIY-YIG nuclease family protein [Thermodesulfobacteriota bacterium]
MSQKRTDNPGIYHIILTKPFFDLPAGRVIYIGKGNDVEYRLKQELGKVSGAATFFRSIGVMLAKTVIPGSGKNFRFYDQQGIADWLEKHTEHTLIRCDWRKEEKKLIKKYKPPFNITHNTRHCHPDLRELRKTALATARKQSAS